MRIEAASNPPPRRFAQPRRDERVGHCRRRVAPQQARLRDEREPLREQAGRRLEFLKIAGNAAEGTIASLAGLPLDEMPGGKSYAEKYKKRFGEDVQTYSPYAYDGAMAMLNAMKKADSTDPAKYLPVLAKTDMAGVTSTHVAYDAKGDLKNGGITMYKVEKGEWKPLKSIGGK